MDRRSVGFDTEWPQKLVSRSSRQCFTTDSSNQSASTAPIKEISEQVQAAYSLDPRQQAKRFNPAPPSKSVDDFKRITPKKTPPREVQPLVIDRTKAQFSPRPAPKEPVVSQLHEVQKPIELIGPVLKQEPLKKKLKLPKLPKLQKMQYAFIAAGLVVFAGGLIVTIMGLRANHDVAAQAQQPQTQQQTTSEANNEQPDESTPPSNFIGSYRVAPDAPKILTIPKLDVKSRILGLGVLPDNQLKTPASIYDTGWYDGSSKPGEQGAMLFDGHVSGPTRPGVFAGLKKLSPGDDIVVERGDGQVFTYKVVRKQTYNAQNTDMTAAMSAVTPNKPGLNLITCTGSFDKKSNHYNDRLIVFTTLAE